MADLNTLTHEQFEACLNQSFALKPEQGAALDLRLVQVDQRGAFDPARAKRQAFSLIFRGPLEPVLPQQIYRLSNEAMGELDIFLVPIGPDQQGMCYEALFT